MEEKVASDDVNLKRLNSELTEKMCEIETISLNILRTGLIAVVCVQLFVSKQSLHGFCKLRYFVYYEAER